MALRFLDGFDNYQAVGGSLTGADFPNIGYSITSTAPNLVLVSQGTSTASKALSINRSPSGYGSVSKQINVTGATKIVVGFAMQANARESIVSFTNLFDVEWLSSGYPKIGSQTGPIIPILNTWYYYEFVINPSTHEVTMWLNGYEQFTSTFTNNVPNTIEIVWGWKVAAPAASLKLDDLYIVDDVDATSKYKDRMGPMEIVTRFPTSNGSVGWSPVPSTKSNWQIVSQVPANTVEFVQSNVVGTADLYASSTAVTGNVLAVAVSTLAAKADVDNHAISVIVEQSGVTKESQNIDLNLQYTYSQGVFEKDANGVDWTAESASAARFGMKVK